MMYSLVVIDEVTDRNEGSMVGVTGSSTVYY